MTAIGQVPDAVMTKAWMSAECAAQCPAPMLALSGGSCITFVQAQSDQQSIAVSVTQGDSDPTLSTSRQTFVVLISVECAGDSSTPRCRQCLAIELRALASAPVRCHGAFYTALFPCLALLAC